MDFKDKIRVGVIGGAAPAARFRDIARDVGRIIAEKGAIMVCGGLSGVMEAAARGAKQAGGLTIGILPGDSPQDANSYIDIGIATGMGYSRNNLVVMNSHVLIAVDGSFGTLSEIAYSQVQGKKVVGIGTWEIQGVIQVDSPEEAVDLALQEFFPLLR